MHIFMSILRRWVSRRIVSPRRVFLTLGASVCITADSAAAEPAPPGFQWREERGAHLDILFNGRIVGRYMFAHDSSSPERRQETYKPFLHLFDADGTAPITKGAGGSFPHHRGIFLGWNKITVGGKSYDRWHMKGGEQIHEEFLYRRSNNATAGFTSQIRWTGDTRQHVLLVEERSINFLLPPKPAYASIDFVSRLKSGAEAVLLNGDPEHAGLHFRPADDVDRKATRYVFPAENADPRKDRDYAWVGETFSLRDKTFSVVLLHHPSNPKGARFSAYRDYGRFGVFWQTEIPTNTTQTFRARFVAYAGEMPGREVIQKAWDSYVGESRDASEND